MNKKDIRSIIGILKKENQIQLANLLVGAQGEIDESSTYGSYLNSTISQYLFYVPLDKIHKAKKMSKSDREELLNAVLCLYPHQDEHPEITKVDFRILQDNEATVIQVENSDLIGCEFTKEQLDKCDLKIRSGDYDGAISTAGSLLEGVFEEIHKKCTGESIIPINDLRIGYRKIKSLLRLSDEQYSNESVKSLMRGLTAIVGSIDMIRNQMGDRHKRDAKPWKRHARLCVNSARIITEFMYETLDAKNEKVEKIQNELIKILDGNKRFLGKDDLLSDEEILKHLSKYDIYLRNEIKSRLITECEIGRFRESDIFFSAMLVFIDEISKDDIERIFMKNKDNDQACGLKAFLELIKREKGKSFITTPIDKYINEANYLEKKHRGSAEIEGVPF